ncbi:acyl carrier protein [Sulfuricaulis sp.]|jgi:acyl carrier protein|uniref:acyl carrier protein n=1 Tax=Sulfuricaulis sp. TaxID=2003553 RepID=UPI003559AD98
MNDIKTQVRQYILNNFLMGGDPERITDSVSFIEKGIIDSTGVLELISFLQETFGIRIEDAEMVPENLDSLEKIEKYVDSKLT